MPHQRVLGGPSQPPQPRQDSWELRLAFLPHRGLESDGGIACHRGVCGGGVSVPGRLLACRPDAGHAVVCYAVPAVRQGPRHGGGAVADDRAGGAELPGSPGDVCWRRKQHAAELPDVLRVPAQQAVHVPNRCHQRVQQHEAGGGAVPDPTGVVAFAQPQLRARGAGDAAAVREQDHRVHFLLPPRRPFHALPGACGSPRGVGGSLPADKPGRRGAPHHGERDVLDLRRDAGHP